MKYWPCIVFVEIPIIALAYGPSDAAADVTTDLITTGIFVVGLTYIAILQNYFDQI